MWSCLLGHTAHVGEEDVLFVRAHSSCFGEEDVVLFVRAHSSCWGGGCCPVC